MKIPFEYILTKLGSQNYQIKQMFGHHCVYTNGMMTLFLIKKQDNENNGICVASTMEHFESLKKSLPSLTAVDHLGIVSKGWFLIPESSSRFKKDAIKACELISQGDERIGRTPRTRKSRSLKRI